jgi:hypothetical protein
MRTLRTLWTAVVVGAIGAGLAGCATGRGAGECLPTDLPDNPQPCTKYCRVWVPPTYRKVPRLCPECPETVEVPHVVDRVRFREVCVKPSEVKWCRTPDTRCEVAAVQTTTGGWKWKRDGQDCWKYVYEPPCYAWCTKNVGEESISYCTQTPAEYKTVAWTERQVFTRVEQGQPRYRVQWVDEVYEPGRYEWVASGICNGCVECNRCPCPPLPKGEPCPPGCPVMTEGCDRCN